ncbi:MAG: 30S ribosomal protein S1 [Bacteroidetes bacterium]|nr:30S ribosomal protein S1 [Bacteroidota bacterium]
MNEEVVQNSNPQPVAEERTGDGQTGVTAVPVNGNTPPPVTEIPIDWDSKGKKEVIYSPEERTRLEETYVKSFQSISQRQVVPGKIISVSPKEVVVNIGYKSEGVISASEFKYNPDLKAGDISDVFIETLEDKDGQLVLSHKIARILKAWDRVTEAFQKNEIITGLIKCRTKGGLIVDVFGMEAFLPGSQIDVKPIKDYGMFVGKTMEFKVAKINNEHKNVVVSHKALIEAEMELQKKEIISKLEKGQVLEGTVKNITSYGVFMDLGGVDGLIHITDLSWGRISHPEEIVKLGQKVNVVILEFDEEKKRISLGLKQLLPHPWDTLEDTFISGAKLKGKVVVVADYGAFVELKPGVEGLIHVSEISWSQHLRSAQEFLKVGDFVDAVILNIDRAERKMTLSIKQLTTNPWDNVPSRYPAGSRHKGKIINIAPYGVFVELEPGVDGLIHISDLSWTKKIKHPSEFTKAGELIDVVILDINTENKRISLGHKQLEDNPWEVFETVFTIGSVHPGTITELHDKGAKVVLPYGVEGYASVKHLVKKDDSKSAVDDKLDFKVIEFSKEHKRIVLSHTRTFREPEPLEEKTDGQEKKKNPKKENKPENSGKEQGEGQETASNETGGNKNESEPSE